MIQKHNPILVMFVIQIKCELYNFDLFVFPIFLNDTTESLEENYYEKLKNCLDIRIPLHQLKYLLITPLSGP